MAVVEVKENNRSSKDINLLNTVSEGIGALGWVTLVSVYDDSAEIVGLMHLLRSPANLDLTSTISKIAHNSMLIEW